MKKVIFNCGLILATVALATASQAQPPKAVAKAPTAKPQQTWWPDSSSPTPAVLGWDDAIKNSKASNIQNFSHNLVLVLKEPQLIPSGSSQWDIGPCKFYFKQTPYTHIDLQNGREFYLNKIYFDPNNALTMEIHSTDKSFSYIICNNPATGGPWKIDTLTISQALDKLKPLFNYKLFNLDELQKTPRVVGSKPVHEEIAYDFQQDESNSPAVH